MRRFAPIISVTDVLEDALGDTDENDAGSLSHLCFTPIAH